MPNNEESWGDSPSNVEFPGADFGHSHTYTEVTHTGWLQRLMGSFMGVIFGIAIFLGSFGVLYWNEGRPDLSEVAKTAVEVDANQPGTKAIGKLAAVAGVLSTDEEVGDAYLEAGDYLAVRREAEMYSWIEESHTETKTNAGGSETKVTTYSYHKGWTGSPSRSMRKSGYNNPSMSVSDATAKATEANVGSMSLDMAKLDLPSYQRLTLNDNMVKRGRVSGNYLYLQPSGSPRLGDIRLTYEVVPNNQKVTVLGQPESATHLVPYAHKTGDTFYRAFKGTKADAVDTMHGEHVLMTWLLRGLGFLMMWGGMFLVLEPLNVFLDVLPFLGGLGRGLTKFGTFLVAVVLSIVTIIVAQILHNIVAMIIIGLVTVLACTALFAKKGARVPRRA